MLRGGARAGALGLGWEGPRGNGLTRLREFSEGSSDDFPPLGKPLGTRLEKWVFRMAFTESGFGRLGFFLLSP